MSFQDVESGAPFPARKELLDSTQDPSQALASGIFQINTSVTTFKRLVNTLGTPKDTPQLRDKIHKIRQHINNLAKETSAKLKAASDSDHAGQVSVKKKVSDAKLAKDFQAILKEFQVAQRMASEKEATYMPLIPQAVLPSSYTASQSNLSEENQSQEQRALLVEQRRQDILQLDSEVVFNEAVIEEREQGIKEIQQQIGEVNEIFKDLAVLVHEQGVMIDNVDTNIESAHYATVQAKQNLSKAAKSQKSNSSLVCLLLVIFGVVLLIIIIVLAI